MTAIGVLLVACAVAANQQWLDRHFLPSFLLSRPAYVAIERIVRVAVALAGTMLLAGRRGAARVAMASPKGVLAVAAAIALAILASEPVVAMIYQQQAQWLDVGKEPLREPHPTFGWTFVPNRVGHAPAGGRDIEYAFDASGYRVRRAGDAVDPRQPTAVFAGESFMFGEGLTWDESIPAQAGALLGVQSANLAVDGYGSDQAYMRLHDALPRFDHPVAVVSLFMPVLLERNVKNDRPHLGPGLVWLPAIHEWRLQALARLFVPYHGAAVVDRGVAVTREVLRGSLDLARRRGAMGLIVVPQFGPEDEFERSLRRRILDDGGVPYTFVPLDPSELQPRNRHPNPAGARAIAAAIAEALRASRP